MMLKVCLAGATGWAGSELARSISKADDLELVTAVGRKHAGRVLGDVLGEPRLTARICASIEEAHTAAVAYGDLQEGDGNEKTTA